MAAAQARNLTMATPLVHEARTENEKKGTLCFHYHPSHQQGQVSSATHMIMNPHSAPSALRARAVAMVSNYDEALGGPSGNGQRRMSSGRASAEQKGDEQ
ncbi:hypothetical protein NL676_021862 [Syzygium grande]|nr:hypothetical protein NL676_021862 [Syzygium grande]